jgi:hypothetical protein
MSLCSALWFQQFWKWSFSNILLFYLDIVWFGRWPEPWNFKTSHFWIIKIKWIKRKQMTPENTYRDGIDMGLSALLWPGPILLTRRPWPYVIHHVHFMNIYRLYIAWYRPILLMYVCCINWYFRNKHRRPLPPLGFKMVDTTSVLVLVSLQCLHCP